jgi:hypothetical protein
MISRSRQLLSLVALAALLGLAEPVHANVIFFDDFSTNNGGGGSNLVPDGWYVTPGSGTVEVVGPAFFGHLCAGGPSPSHCVDLDGSTPDDAGILNKDFDLAPSSYEVSFWYRGNNRPPAASDTFTVSLDGLFSQTFTNIPASAGWTQFSFLVDVPTSQTLTLSFANAGGDNIGILIDDVQVETPEPGTLLLIGTGLTGLVLRRRRQA